MEINTSYTNINSIKLFVVNCSIYFVSLWIEFNYIFTDNFYKSSLIKTFHNENQIFDYILKDRGLEWKNYAFIPLLVFSITCLIALSIFIGFNTVEQKISIKDSFKITLQSIIVYPLNYFITVILKLFHVLSYKFENVNDIYKYQSVLRFINIEKLPQWAIYPLEKLNITEFVYFLVLALFINLHFHFKLKKSIKYSIIIYGIGLFIWIIFSVFIKIVFFT